MFRREVMFLFLCMKLFIVFTGPELKLLVLLVFRCETIQNETAYVLCSILSSLMYLYSDK